MDDIELVVSFFRAVESKDWPKLSGLLAEDFQYYGPTPDPFGKEVWLDFQRAVQSAFPDWAYNLQKVEKKGHDIEVVVHITGTHQGELALPIEGFSPIPPTNKKIEMPHEHAFLKIENGKVKELKVEQQLHGSLPGLLEQIGLE